MAGLRPAAPRYSEMARLEYSALLRTASIRSHRLLSERNFDRMQELVLQDALELLGASAARFHTLDPVTGWQVTRIDPDREIPPLATAMEAELLSRAVAARKSLISSHPLLDAELLPLERACREEGITTHLLLVRAHQRTYGAIGVHWLEKPRPVDFDGRSVFYHYADHAGLAVATAVERERLETELRALEQTAFCDRLTGLPNSAALERELESHADTWPLSVLVVDFDGLRAANHHFGYERGGDLLISTVGHALAELADGHKYPARLHTAGDEFAVLLPGSDEQDAGRVRFQLEARLDTLPVPTHLAEIYQGASVGHATRQPGETAGQVLGRATEAMRARKHERKQRPAKPR